MMCDDDAAPTNSPAVLIVGGGAVGALYGSRLQVAGARVAVVCRSNLSIVAANGYKIDSSVWGTSTFTPNAGVFATPAAAAASLGTAFDHVIMTTKALPDVCDDSLLIEPVVTSGRTLIHLIQNGVGIEDPHVARFPNNAVSSSVTYVAVSQHESGMISHKGLALMSIGLHASPDPKRDRPVFDRMVDLLRAGGFDVNVHVNIQQARWHKLMWNASFSSLSIIGGCIDTITLLDMPEMEDLVRRTMAEIESTASVLFGGPFPAGMDLIDTYVSRTRRVGKYRPSMLLDYECGRAIEIEVILGNPVRMASSIGNVDMPLTRGLYALLKSLDAQRKRLAAGATK